ncbi:hydroxypyruvate isomerase family protein [Microlunatus soli]|uniref:Hydroxypyruvate isomerase n=1 Tax=Microlunatus soli TaxID=630515 RepID=A0A1H1QIS2_9ACTN|nr:TIM barrel protein [Microlunatus soli]SDS23421.1 hydroxypyruvate isomerase [Microlunatus soli]
MSARDVVGDEAVRWDLVANVSLLFDELPLLERPNAAKQAGFTAVEAWWSFPSPRGGQELTAFLDAVERADLSLAGLNLFAGDMAAGERGVLSAPHRRDEFRANLDVVVEVAARTGARGFNALYGQRLPGVEPAEQDRVALENLELAVQRLAEVGGTVLIEPLSRNLNGAYPIETAEQAIDIVDRVREAAGQDNIALLFDTFHLANNGADLPAVIDRYADRIGHVQLADAPGRGAPGTGTVDFSTVMDSLASNGYKGLIAAEYVPGEDTERGLDWVDGQARIRLT